MNAAPKVARRALIAGIVLLGVLYAGDYVSAKHRILKNTPGDPLEAVKIQPMYVIPHKDGQAEYVFGDPQTQTCLHSLFPHLGYSPCWYVKKHTQQTVPMTIFLLRLAACLLLGRGLRDRRSGARWRSRDQRCGRR